MGGLCGMEYDRQWKSYRMIRPLLGVQRAQIEAYLAEKEQDYCSALLLVKKGTIRHGHLR